MGSTQVFDEIRDAMATMFELDPSQIQRQSRLGEDLDLDSIDAIDLVVKLQDITHKRIDQSALKQVRTVGDIVDLVELLIEPRA